MRVAEAYRSVPESFEKIQPDRVVFMPPRYREHFALGSTTYPASQARTLDPVRYYQQGTIKPGVTTTTTPAQFGGATCPSDFPSTVYRLFRGDDAQCTLTDSSLYVLDTTNTTCQLDTTTNTWKRSYIRKSDTAIDTLDTTATGVTTKLATYDGTKCSAIVKANPTQYPATKLLGTACAAVPATCDLTDNTLYTVDLGMNGCSNTNSSGQFYDTAQRFYRPFGLRTDLENITTKASQYGGLTCTQQVQANTTAYPSSKILNIAGGTASRSYCAPVQADCDYNPLSIYTIRPITSTGSQDYASCTRNTTDNLWYRPLGKRTDLETLTKTGSAARYGGLTCTQQIGPVSTTYPSTKIVGSGTTAPSYCPPIPASCQNAVTDNQDTNYTFFDPVLGNTFIPVDCSFVAGPEYWGTNTQKRKNVSNVVAPKNGGMSCQTFLNGTADNYYSIQYNADGITPAYLYWDVPTVDTSGITFGGF